MMMMTIITQTAGFWLPVTENPYRQTKIDFWLSFNFDDHDDDYDDNDDHHIPASHIPTRCEYVTMLMGGEYDTVTILTMYKSMICMLMIIFGGK